MKKIKTIAIVTAMAMLISMMPVMSFAASAPAKAKITGVTQASGDQSATVTWNKVKNATGYQVAYKAAGGSYKAAKTVKKGSVVKYRSGQLAAGKTYYYKVRAYKKSGSKKIYGKYSDAKKIRIVRSKPDFTLNNIINNKIEGSDVVTEFSITVDSKCDPLYLVNSKGSNNKVVRYFGIDDVVYKNAKAKMQEIMLSEDKDCEEISDEMLTVLQGQYQFSSMTPSVITVNGTTVEKGSTMKLEAGETYTIQYMKAADALCPYTNVFIGMDEYNYPTVHMEYEKLGIGNVYRAGFDGAWDTQGAYMMALKYRGTDYDATMAMDFEKGAFSTKIQ